MQVGVVFPHTEVGVERAAVERYVKGVESLGFSHLLAYDHVLGADRTVHEGLPFRYDIDSTFHEPFVLFGFVAAITTLELATGILILPQRQTALVAKQAAEVDRLTGGKFRLGIGVGWNPVEYEALGTRFTDRGTRVEEQLALLRALWTERSVTHRGNYETVTAAGINPLPIQQPIPIWFGGQTPPAYRRAGRLGDGWIPQGQPGPDLEQAKELVWSAGAQVGRDFSRFGIEGRLAVNGLSRDEIAERAAAWQAFGATHLSLVTMNGGLVGPDAHVDALVSAADTLL